MAGLELTGDGAKFKVEPLGNVTRDGAQIGSWKTNEKNQIVVTKSDGAKIPFDVEWKFNADNHLVVSAGGRELDFNGIPTNRVVYSLDEAVLVVTPASGKPFKFELIGDWDLTENHDLKFTVNRKSSVIDGRVSDKEGRFFFVFNDKSAIGAGGSTLKFSGRWEHTKDDAGQIFLRFFYQPRGSTGEKVFALPKAVTFKTSANQLAYEYEKDNRTQSIQFFGALVFDEDFQLTYTLNRQTEGGREMAKSTTFTVGMVYAKENVSGNLELAVQKRDGKASGTVFVIGGGFTAVIAETSVKAGFSFRQEKQGGGKTSARAFGFNAGIVHKNGRFQIEFQTENTIRKTISLEIGAEIQIGPADINSKLTVRKENGELVGVTFLLGVFI